MPQNLINEGIADQIITALCNTLLHSLWQGIILAAIAGLVIVFTKKASASLRYNLLVSAFLLFTITVICTFCLQFSAGHPAPVSQFVNPAPLAAVHIYQPAASLPVTTYSVSFLTWLSNHHTTIVLVCFLIICIKSVQLGFGLAGTYRLKRVKVFAVDNHWQQRMQQLASKLHIKQTIRLLESGLAKVPVVIGNLKPVILIPAGLLTALTTEQVEAILIHELEHISRKDYLVNMLQSLLEIVFFFNPAVIWISRLIKTERENCCDDLTIAQSSSKINYIMALTGGKSSLLNRVKRMTGDRNHSLNLFEKTTLAVCVVIAGLCMSAYTAKENNKTNKHIVKPVVSLSAPRVFSSIQKSAMFKEMAKPEKQNVAAINNNLHHKTYTDTTRPNVSALDNEDTVKNYGAASANYYANNYTKPSLDPALLNEGSSYPSCYPPGPPGTDLYRRWNRQDSIANTHIITDMMKDGLITDDQHLNFKLGTKEFIVNGKKQDEDIHIKYWQKYVPPAEIENNNDWVWSHSLNYT